MSTKKAWGGRFQKATDPVVEEFSASIHFDARLAQVDIRGSIAHARMLARAEIISDAESDILVAGLEDLAKDFAEGKIELDQSCEDIHMLVEKRLFERIGQVAGKLHTARSRNDQVALDLRLWTREAAESLDEQIGKMQFLLLESARQHVETIIPGYTHLQRAQPVTLAHHLLAYFWMFDRDRSRLASWRERANYCPLGAAAMAGTSLSIDRSFTAEALGFISPIPNSMDAVSDRDFVIELVFICSLVMGHLSRMAEEAIIWSTAEFGFLELDDSIATGSSIMPQKKNPDVAELTRGKFGRVLGDLTSLLTLIKGLPLTYMRDLQEDKPALFDALDNTIISLKAMERLIATSKFNTERMYEAADDGFTVATDLAEFLVKQHVPFRTAHEVVGSLVHKCVNEGRRLDDLSAQELAEAHPALSPEALQALRTLSSVKARKHAGGTSPEAVRRQIEEATLRFSSRS